MIICLKWFINLRKNMDNFNLWIKNKLFFNFMIKIKIKRMFYMILKYYFSNNSFFYQILK
jgi:hypothetical protein